jgi:hypothetical protein
VNEITTLDIAKVLTPVWRTKPEVARKLYPAIRRVFDRARVILRDQHGIELSRNPADWSDLKAMGFRAPTAAQSGPAAVIALRANTGVHGKPRFTRRDCRSSLGVPDPDRRQNRCCAEGEMGSDRPGAWRLDRPAVQPQGQGASIGRLSRLAVGSCGRDRAREGAIPHRRFRLSRSEAWATFTQYGAADAVATHECWRYAALE